MTHHPASHVLASGISRVDQPASHVLSTRHLTCRPYGISRVTIRHLTCQPTREMPSKHSHTSTAILARLFFRSVFAVQLIQRRQPASCGALRRERVLWSASVEKEETKTLKAKGSQR